MTTPYVDPVSVHNPSAGGVPPASWGDTVRDDIDFLAKTPGCIVKTNAALSLTNSSVTAVPFAGGDDRDTDNFHSTTTNNTRMVVPAGQGGVYEIGATLFYSNTSSSGSRGIFIRINGASQIATFQWTGASSSGNSLAGIPYLLVPTDYVEIQAFQDSGGALNLNSARAWMRLVAVA